MTPSWRFLDFKTYPPKHAKGEATKSQSGPDAAAIKGVKDELCATPLSTPEDEIKKYTQGDLTPKQLQAQCKAEYDAITALFNAKTILKEFKGNALFKDNKFIEDIESLMEGIKHVE